MGRSQNWPDLKSPKSIIKDMHFVATNNLMISWKFHIDCSKPVAPVASQTFLEVGSLDLTWWPNLRWPGDNFLGNEWKGWLIRYAKNGGAARRCFYAMLEKPEGDSQQQPVSARDIRYYRADCDSPRRTMPNLTTPKYFHGRGLTFPISVWRLEFTT